MPVPEQVLLTEALPIADTRDTELEEAVRAHSSLVYRVAYSVLRNHHDAEDAAQETFVRLLRFRRRLATVRDRRAWLARTAWRVALDRKRKARNVTLEEAAVSVARLRAAGAGAEEIAVSQQMTALLERLIESLPRELRQPLTLSCVQEFSSPEIAAVLGIPEGSVRTRLMRARHILRQKIKTILEGHHGR